MLIRLIYVPNTSIEKQNYDFVPYYAMEGCFIIIHRSLYVSYLDMGVRVTVAHIHLLFSKYIFYLAIQSGPRFQLKLRSNRTFIFSVTRFFPGHIVWFFYRSFSLILFHLANLSRLIASFNL